MAPTTADIRKFLTELFSDEELTSLCYDYFRDVYLDFALGMSKGQKIQRLIEYCGHHGATPNLLAAMASERPTLYADRFGAPVEAAAPAAEQPRPGRDPHQVFISHAHEDAEFAHRLAADLAAGGWRVWITPESILPGEKWVDAIERGLATSGVFVVALTPAAIRSRWVKTETNAAIALEHREMVRLVPLDVETCDAPLLWSSYQCVSFRGAYEAGLRGLLGWLDPPKTSTSTPPATPVQKPAAEPRVVDAAPPARQTVPAIPKTASTAPPQTAAQALPRLLTIESPIHLELVLVPTGEFLMGSDPKVDKDAQPDQQPQHRLYLPEFYIGKVPITNAQFAGFIRATRRQAPSHWENGALPPGRAEHPVVNVTWDDAVAFCRWLSEATHRSFRLPSEAEWEKAARGGDGRIYPWGNPLPDEKRCNFGMKIGATTPVGNYPDGASPCGALDMAGNVWEWTGSIFESYPYAPADGREDPGNRETRVLRGGSFWSGALYVRCACRGRLNPDNRSDVSGFRVVSPGF
jgi:formylglycine-generating enzyme